MKNIPMQNFRASDFTVLDTKWYFTSTSIKNIFLYASLKSFS